MTATTTAASPLAETQRRTRGHNFYPPKADRRKVPAPYATEGTATDEKIAVLHWFTGPFDFYAIEVDWSTGVAFGLTVLNGHRELGYQYLPELEAMRPAGSFTRTGAAEGVTAHGWMRWVVERDCWWTPVPVGEVR